MNTIKRTYRIFIKAIVITAIIIAVKYLLHANNMEIIVLGSLHGSVISGVIFVIGFILSTTISDYKEAERIPAEIASTLEDMNEDVIAIYDNYPKFDIKGYQEQLKKVASGLAGDLRSSKSDAAKTQLYKLGRLHAAMEKSGVPANFIVKLKQQQAMLVRHLFRVNYIQRITFIPSATILAWSIVILTIVLLLFTEIEPFVGGVILSGVISFILVYVLQLINVIKTPFHDEGKTRDDVSLFLIDRTIRHLETSKLKK
ncbi:MAG TPA: hypothetical protein VLG09_05485 [Candidatus Saccharimonadales bacterium]|nr:hypothetical protein [Candidatus Saccharimonadales bacterium]